MLKHIHTKRLYFESVLESKVNQNVNIQKMMYFVWISFINLILGNLNAKKKLSCHCGGSRGQVEVPETGFKKIMRCNCSICKRKGYIIGVAGQMILKLLKEKIF